MQQKAENIFSDKDLVRLNKYIANSGICSRREADKYISAGLVSVNEKKINELGFKVSVNDTVKINGKKLTPEKKIYVLLNKPKNYISTMDDPHATKKVIDLVCKACKERIYPVGRLDKKTTGVLLFTNDGELTKKLTHPRYNVKKIYYVVLDKMLEKDDITSILNGIELDDGHIKADVLNYVNDRDKTQVSIEIHSGRKRIVRRIFKHFGYRIYKLDRIYFAGLTKKNLFCGKWRYLTEKEVTLLKTIGKNLDADERR